MKFSTCLSKQLSNIDLWNASAPFKRWLIFHYMKILQLYMMILNIQYMILQHYMLIRQYHMLLLQHYLLILYHYTIILLTLYTDTSSLHHYHNSNTHEFFYNKSFIIASLTFKLCNITAQFKIFKKSMLWYLRCCISKPSKSSEREYEKRVEEN